MNYKTGSAFEFMRRMWAPTGQLSVDPYLTLQNAVDPFFNRLRRFQTTVVIQPSEMFLAAGNTLKHVSIGLVQRIVPTMVSAASATHAIFPNSFAILLSYETNVCFLPVFRLLWSRRIAS